MSQPTKLPIIDVELRSDKVLDIGFANKKADISIDNIKVIQKTNVPYYEGDYEIDPKFEEQILETKDKKMKEDVTVNPIYVSRTDNLSGGITVYIGGILNG